MFSFFSSLSLFFIMSITWGDLPREILEIVFKKLKEEYFNIDYDLRECSLVCHGWALAAQEVLFSTANLNSEADVEKLIYTVACKPSLAGFVKFLNYRYHEKTSYRHVAHLAIFAKFFPHLERFDASGFIDDPFYELFCNLVNDGKFPYLKEFPKSWNTHQDSLRASCLISHGKNSITELKLFRHDDTSRNEYKLICHELPQFSKLDELEITVISEVPQSVIKYIESVTLSTARKLDFTLDFPEVSILGEQDFRKVQPMVKVKKFSASLWRRLNIDHADFILYLMKKFPNLDDLKLSFHHHWYIKFTGPGSAKLTSTSILFNQFFKYLSKISEFSFSHCYVDANKLSYLVEQFLINNDSKKKKPVELTLTSRGSHSDHEQVSYAIIELCRRKKRMVNEISVILVPEVYDLVCSSFLEAVGDSFNSLIFDSNDTPDLPTVLNDIAEFCPNLESLSITGSIYLDSANKNHASYETHSQLKTLTLYHDFSSELFPILSKQFPCLENLILRKFHSEENDAICGFAYLMNQKDPSASKAVKNRKITYFDMLNFSIKHLTIEASVEEYMFEARLKHMYLRIITQNDGRTRYCHIIAPSPTEEYPKKKQDFEIAENPTEAEYMSTIGHAYYLHYEISCNYVEKIKMIEYPINFDTLSIEFYVI